MEPRCARGNPGADGRWDAAGVLRGAREGDPDAVGDDIGGAVAETAQRDTEFLAADPPDEIVAAQRAAGGVAEYPKHLVAGGVPVGVVDLLEPVEIEQDEAKRIVPIQALRQHAARDDP